LFLQKIEHWQFSSPLQQESREPDRTLGLEQSELDPSWIRQWRYADDSGHNLGGIFFFFISFLILVFST